MLRKFTRTSLFALSMAVAATFNPAQAAEPVGYELVSPAQPTHDVNKVEVIEFFWYGCPHCFDFEPTLAKWVKTLPKNVEFIRQPAVFSDLWGKHAKAYYTAEALGVVDKVHQDFFDTIQIKKEHLETEEQLAKFFTAHGVAEADFKKAYNSFPVDMKVRQAGATAAKYAISGVPAIVINGKYKTSGPLAGSHEKMIEIMDKLIAQESGAKK
ncbi:MAG: thiol:disulfide interchange protein DsbA/DsbL [Methylococcales bacterium]|nr:thiol:disulfide interchange protein DsbA/DsbL [Methylococcales bacterium]